MTNAGQRAVMSSSTTKTIKPSRPSLSKQLEAIGLQAQQLTSDIRSKAGLKPLNTVNPIGGGTGSGDEQPLLTMPAKNFMIGTLNCRYPSPIAFYRDRYNFFIYGFIFVRFNLNYFFTFLYKM